MLESHLPHLGALATSLGSSRQGAAILETQTPEAGARPISSPAASRGLSGSLGVLESWNTRPSAWSCPAHSRCPIMAQPVGQSSSLGRRAQGPPGQNAETHPPPPPRSSDQREEAGSCSAEHPRRESFLLGDTVSKWAEEIHPPPYIHLSSATRGLRTPAPSSLGPQG